MAKEKESETDKLLREYLGKARVMIADPSSASRRRLCKMICDLGAKVHQVIMHSKYEEAQEELEKNKPNFVMVEYQIGGRSGLELLQTMRASGEAAMKESVFMLITGDPSQSAVARAAEEDVDSFIVKPYTIQSFKETLVSSATAKLFPTDYKKKIDAGKVLLFSGQPEQAETLFDEACQMDPKPALALFYKGQAKLMKEMMRDAKDSFENGLKFNEIHYKCLIGLFELLMEQKKYAEAYDVVLKVAHTFPANPVRLTQIVRLAVINGKYEDLENYYKVFTELDARNDQVIRSICAGLITSAKFFFRNDQRDRAVGMVEKASVSAAGNTSLLLYAIEAFWEAQLKAPADGVLKRFPAETQTQSPYLIAKVLAEDLSGQVDKTVGQAMILLQQGHQSPILYRALIRALLNLGKTDEANRIAEEATRLYPDEKRRFDAILQLTVAKAA